VGTLSNVIVVGIIVNWVLDVLFCPHGLPTRMAVLGAAIVLNGLSTGYYIGAGLGPGPRDGLTTGFAARGHSVRVTRTVIEVSALVLGYFLGGSVGVGTIAYAVSIGPLIHIFLPRLSLPAPPRRKANKKPDLQQLSFGMKVSTPVLTTTGPARDSRSQKVFTAAEYDGQNHEEDHQRDQYN
jgi:uncharacterized membrane protein YczE